MTALVLALRGMQQAAAQVRLPPAACYTIDFPPLLV